MLTERDEQLLPVAYAAFVVKKFIHGRKEKYAARVLAKNQAEGGTGAGRNGVIDDARYDAAFLNDAPGRALPSRVARPSSAPITAGLLPSPHRGTARLQAVQNGGSIDFNWSDEVDTLGSTRRVEAAAKNRRQESDDTLVRTSSTASMDARPLHSQTATLAEGALDRIRILDAGEAILLNRAGGMSSSQLADVDSVDAKVRDLGARWRTPFAQQLHGSVGRSLDETVRESLGRILGKTISGGVIGIPVNLPTVTLPGSIPENRSVALSDSVHRRSNVSLGVRSAAEIFSANDGDEDGMLASYR